MYTYHDLVTPTSFRLIELQPGAKGDDLKCNIVHSDLASNPRYEAVSYVWGDETNKQTIHCGSSGETLEITRNLAALLRQFRPADAAAEPRVLWTDSICINQQDIPERNKQVVLMCDIYSKAESVLIWLGDENDGQDTAKAWKCMDLLLRRFWPRRDELKRFMADGPTMRHYNRLKEEKGPSFKTSFTRNEAEISAFFDIPGADSPELEAVWGLLRRPWFDRAWTFQESYLAQRRIFHCGSYRIEGPDVVNVFASLIRLHGATNNIRYFDSGKFNGSRMLEGKGFFRSDSAGFFRSLMFLLSIRRGSGCKDKRDLVFSLLGAGEDKYDIIPDYEESNSVDKVFIDVATKVVFSTKHLDLLRHVNNVQDPSLPSWVPDWRVRFSTRNVSQQPCRLYNSTGNSNVVAQISKDGKEIEIEGIEIGQISSVDINKEGGSWVKTKLGAEPGDLYKFTNETMDTAWLRTCCADLTLYDPENENRRWDSTSVEKVNSIEAGAGAKYVTFLTKMIKSNVDCRLFVTQNGNLGIAHMSIEIDDVVVALLGGEVPYVLRPVETPVGRKYSFICECYLHGFMDGEALVEARQSIDPDYDGKDTTWLSRLDQEIFEIGCSKFVLV